MTILYFYAIIPITGILIRVLDIPITGILIRVLTKKLGRGKNGHPRIVPGQDLSIESFRWIPKCPYNWHTYPSSRYI